VLRAFQADAISHKEIFPLGHPFKCLYAIYALREYLSSRRHVSNPEQIKEDQESGPARNATTSYSEALARAMSLTVAAICDHEVIHRCASQELQIFLSTTLVNSLLEILKDPLQTGSFSKCLDAELLERLLQILGSAVTAPPSETATGLVNLTFQAVLECCCMSRGFWDALSRHSEVGRLTGTLLLDDWRPRVRSMASTLIGEKVTSSKSSSAVAPLDFAVFFWPIVSGLIPAAVHQPYKCEEVFTLAFTIFKTLRETRSSVLDIQALLNDYCNMLLAYTTLEARTAHLHSSLTILTVA
jgi:ubiquitin carboxyl-terminal hydrolase 34